MKTNINQFKKYIDDEFDRIMKDARIHLYADMSIKNKKEFLSEHVPKEVIHSSEVLFDTVLNALMSEARDKLKDTPVELQNKFYDYDFRKKVREWVLQEGNRLSLAPEYVEYSLNPQLIYGFGYSIPTFAIGAVITKIAFEHIKMIGVVSGVLTLILSPLVFKLAYDKAEPKAISKMEKDIETYLEGSKEQLTKWLCKVIEYFDREFQSFCKENELEVE